LINEHGDMIAISVYRKLEADLYDQIYDLEFENAGLRVELEQQAICNGKGSEREAALLAEVDDLQRQLDNARTGWLCDTCDGRGCEAMNQNTVLLAELEEQTRLNGKGSEREAALLAKVETLQRENAALRADKARLDWLESAAKDLICTADGLGVTIGVASNFQDYATNAATFRAALDAARKEQP
jgi:hypothetical protein